MVLNIAHGGACSLAPENTLAAARKALEVGADMWELDVAVTADSDLVAGRRIIALLPAGARRHTRLVSGASDAAAYVTANRSFF